MGRNDFDRRSDVGSPMKGGMMNTNRGGFMNRGGFSNSNRGGGAQNRGGQQNRGGPSRGGMPHRGGPGGRGSHQNNRGGQQRPRGGSQSSNTITVTPSKNITTVKQDKPTTPQPVKEEKKTPVKQETQTTPGKTEKTTPQSPKTTPQGQHFKSPQPRQPQTQPQQPRSTPPPNVNSNNMRPATVQKLQTPTQQNLSGAAQQTQTPKEHPKPQQNQSKAQQQNQGRNQQYQGGPSQAQQQNQNRSSQQTPDNRSQQNQRDFRQNRNDRGFSHNRRDKGENRFSERGNKDEGMESQPNAPKEEKKFTMRCRLFIGNLTAETSEEEFKAMFEPYGELNEVYLNPQRGFGFCRLDYRSNAEAAKVALDGTMRKGRTLRVRFASHGAALKVKNLSPFVSNELLESAFSILGEVERAVVICDDRGKSIGEGIVEFARKQVALSAIKRINDGAFLLTSSPRPIFVEPLEQKDDEDGLLEKFIPKNDQYRKEREMEPRFAPPGSFEYSFAGKWKQIVEMEKSQLEQVNRNVEEAKLKLEGEMENAQMEHQEELIRKDLMRQQEELRRLQEIRQQSELRRRQEMEMRMRQQEEEERIRQEQQQRRQDMMIRRNDNLRHPMGSDTMGQEEIMMGQGGIHDLQGGSNRGNAPPLPPPPAPPASMGLDRGRSQMSGGMGNNYGNPGMGGPVGMGGDASMGGPGGQMPPFDGASGNNFGGTGNTFQGQGNMGGMGGGMGGVSGPGNIYNQGGMGGNMNSGGLRGNERGMDRRREGGPREDYGEMKRMRRF